MRIIPLLTLPLLLGIGPAAAQSNVDFLGTVVATCALTLATPGVLALNTDGDILSSETLPGAPGTVTVLSIGNNDIGVDAPIMQAAPAEYDDSADVLEVAYSGLSGLSAVDQDFTTGDTEFAVGTIAATVLTVHNRVTNPNGFAAGNYTTRTVVTCNPS